MKNKNKNVTCKFTMTSKKDIIEHVNLVRKNNSKQNKIYFGNEFMISLYKNK